ncbi:MAG: hypothetical protein AABY22_02580, partial [Nanoarchaeota archaeon]
METNLTTEKYDWGILRKVEFGEDGKDGVAIIHPENWEDIIKLSIDDNIQYRDEQGIEWRVTKIGPSKFLFVSRNRIGLDGIVELFDDELAEKGKKIAGLLESRNEYLGFKYDVIYLAPK